MLVGYQRVVKGHYRGSQVSNSIPGDTAQSNYVIIFVVVFRLEHKDTDIVISLNYPLTEEDDIVEIHNPDTDALLAWMEREPGLNYTKEVLREIIANFEILDWNLFDEDDEE